VWTLANLVLLYHALGRYDVAGELIDELEQRAKTEPVPPYALALAGFRSATPDFDLIFDTLDRSVAARDFWLVMCRVEPFFDLVRHDPRYDALVRKVGIPEFRA
jgi:hypothetical protein